MLVGRESMYSYLNKISGKLLFCPIVSWFNATHSMYQDSRPKMNRSFAKWSCVSEKLKERKLKSNFKLKNLLCPGLQLDEQNMVVQDE